MSDNAARAVLGTAAIPGAAPTGASVKYEPDFEQLVAEVGKLESIEGRNTIRWADVVELSSGILAGKSKDLLVASYLTLGLLHQEGYAGLAEGLAVLKGLLTTFWDGLFPEKARMRARQAALQWMADRTGDALTGLGDASESDREALASAERLVEELSTFVRDNFGENLPDLSNLARLVGEKHASVPAPAAAPEPEAAPAEGAGAEAPAAAAAPAAPRPIDTPEAAREALRSQRERRLQAARVLRDAAPADPLPYRLLREATWEDLVELPPNRDGRLEGWVGDPAFAAELERKLEAGDFAAVAAEAEAKLPQERFWLDLNFFTVRALEGLGRPCAEARKAVGLAVAGLLRRLPALLEMNFSDGAPLASDATRLWIRTEAGAEAAPAGTGGVVESALAEARALVARNAFAEATDLVLQRYRALTSRRDRFRCRLALAKLCLEGGRADLALPQLEGLDEESRKVGLEDWEPEIAAELARALWTCYRVSSNPERGDVHFMRLCRLDPSAALAGKGTSPGKAPG